MRSSNIWRRGTIAAGLLAGACGLLIGHALGQTGRDDKGSKAGRLAGKGVTIPLEHDDAGRLKSVVYAETATAAPNADGEIRADGVRMVLAQTADDTNVTVVLSESCKINGSNMTARSNFGVRLEQNGLVMTGMGFRWSGEKEQMKILKDARVVITRSLVEQRRGPSSAPTTLPGFRKDGY